MILGLYSIHSAGQFRGNWPLPLSSKHGFPLWWITSSGSSRGSATLFCLDYSSNLDVPQSGSQMGQSEGSTTPPLTKTSARRHVAPSLHSAEKNPVTHRWLVNLWGHTWAVTWGKWRAGYFSSLHFCGKLKLFNIFIRSLEPGKIQCHDLILLSLLFLIFVKKTTQVILSDGILNEPKYSYTMQGGRSYYWGKNVSS